MAQSDLLITLVGSVSSGDERLLKETVESLTAEERASHHHVLADCRVEGLHSAKPPMNRHVMVEDQGRQFYCEEVHVRMLNDLLLSDDVCSGCLALIEEQHRRERRQQLEAWFRRFEARLECLLLFTARVLATKMQGVSFAEAEVFPADIQRQYVLSLSNADVKAIVSQRLKQWQECVGVVEATLEDQ